MRGLIHRVLPVVGLGCALAFTAACGDDDAIDSNQAAQRAYLGLDPSIEQSLALGFAGFNSASSANIAPQSAPGAATGTLTITGQVDQGSSANKGMRLRVGMVDYSAGPFVVVVNEDEQVTVDLGYTTSDVVDQQPYLQLQLRNIPSGTFSGDLTGVYHVHGDIEGDVTLTLTMTGALQDAGGGMTNRAPGTTTVTGTATSGDGVYQVMVTI